MTGAMSPTRTAQTATQAQDSGASALLLQRKCACRGSAGLSGECEECRTKRLLGKPLQAKLRINEPGDEYEQEADRVADQVMRMPDESVDGRSPPSTATPLVQRKVRAGNVTDLGSAPSTVHDVLLSPGHPLDARARAFLEPRFRHDFSSVRVHHDANVAESAGGLEALTPASEPHGTPTRDAEQTPRHVICGKAVQFARHPAGQASPAPSSVGQALNSPGTPIEPSLRRKMERSFSRSLCHVRLHTGGAAQSSARELGARAYTVGNHIVFPGGQSELESPAYRFLLAHELTHVLQQSSSSPATMVQCQFVTPLGAGGGFGGLMERDRRAAEREQQRQLTAEEAQERQEAAILSWRDRGRTYGFTLAQAIQNVALHNDQLIPDDWDLIPEDRRPFIEFVDQPHGPWRLHPPRVTITDPDYLEAFVDGVNQGLEKHAAIEHFFAPIAKRYLSRAWRSRPHP
jgi:hypothetical protein